jgi:hypothetical protein
MPDHTNPPHGGELVNLLAAPGRSAEVAIDTTDLRPEEAAQEVFLHLEKEGFIGVNRHGTMAAESATGN